jgi:hypothetical protein
LTRLITASGLLTMVGVVTVVCALATARPAWDDWILDARAARAITRQAREYYTGAENAKVTAGTAMLINSSVGRIIGNFLIQVNRPAFPIRLFSDETEALRWLAELRDGLAR